MIVMQDYHAIWVKGIVNMFTIFALPIFIYLKRKERIEKSMGMHSFDTDIAEKVGIESAILYYHLCFWCEHNKANDKHYHDGYYWTYNSIVAYKELFPYMKEKAIRRSLKRLEEEGYIITGNYNNSTYDRTKWYAVKNEKNTLKALKTPICQKGQMDLPKRTDQYHINNKYNNNNKNNNNNNKNNRYSANRFNDFEQNDYNFREIEKIADNLKGGM